MLFFCSSAIFTFLEVIETGDISGFRVAKGSTSQAPVRKNVDCTVPILFTKIETSDLIYDRNNPVNFMTGKLKSLFLIGNSKALHKEIA